MMKNNGNFPHTSAIAWNIHRCVSTWRWKTFCSLLHLHWGSHAGWSSSPFFKNHPQRHCHQFFCWKISIILNILVSETGDFLTEWLDLLQERQTHRPTHWWWTHSSGSLMQRSWVLAQEALFVLKPLAQGVWAPDKHLQCFTQWIDTCLSVCCFICLHFQGQVVWIDEHWGGGGGRGGDEEEEERGGRG